MCLWVVFLCNHPLSFPDVKTSECVTLLGVILWKYLEDLFVQHYVCFIHRTCQYVLNCIWKKSGEGKEFLVELKAVALPCLLMEFLGLPF